MSVKRLYGCDACGEKFWFEAQSRKAPAPECPYCAGTGQKTDDGVIHLSLRKREEDAKVRDMVAQGGGPGVPNKAADYLRSSDQVFRAMEAGSEFRAQAAADQLGVPVAEMSNLKITDMKDRPKPGETSVKMPMSPEGHMMEARARQMSFSPRNNEMGAEYAKATQVGPSAGKHGTNMASLLRQNHASTEAAVRSRGEIRR